MYRGLAREPKRVACGMSALLHGGRREGREADHVSDGINMWKSGLEVFVYFQSTSVVRLNADIRQAELLRRADSPDRVKQQGSRDLFAAFKPERHGVVSRLLNTHDFFVEAQGHPDAAHLILQCFDDLGIDELQQPRPPLDEDHGNSKRCQDAGVFAADDTPADNG